MRPYVFSIGVLLMLLFTFTGLAFTTARALRWFELRFGALLPHSIATGELGALIVALAWSVPPRG